MLPCKENFLGIPTRRATTKVGYRYEKAINVSEFAYIHVYAVKTEIQHAVRCIGSGNILEHLYITNTIGNQHFVHYSER